MDVQTVKLTQRTLVGKKVKRLRKVGILPVHVYGTKADPESLQGDMLMFRRLILQVGTNIPVSLEVEGKQGNALCFIRVIQRHPVTEDLLHIDFMRVDVALTTRAEVPITLVGEAPATRIGGTLLQPLQSIMVEALPMNIPGSLDVDVSDMDDFEKAIYVRDITSLGSNVTIITDPDEMVARVIPPRVESEMRVSSEETLGAAEESAKGESSEDES
ncbi:MAG: 50S ribosomal protein L25 [Chloroflexi bacterium]|nr:50S ribosomal protein L25 [Chloroflexota bacterium]MDA1228957.1 50S ribosomal protein L25 [Chloroflexota bacterium]